MVAVLPCRVRVEDRGEVAFGEPVERRCVPERPINPIDLVAINTDPDGFVNEMVWE